VSPSVGGGTLLMPGGQAPTSRLLVTPPRKPSAAPRAARGTVERKPRKPRKARAETKTAKAAPKPPPKPMAKPAVKKAPKPDSKRTAVAQKPDSAPVSSAPPPPPAIPGAPDIASAPPPTPTSLAPEKKTATAPAAPADKEQASAAPDASSIAGDGGKSVRVVFAETSAKVPGAMTAPLKSLADQLNAKDTLRLQLKAYAGGQDMTPSKARRLSLSRALSVRSQLISAGVRSTRIDVRALGDKTTEEPLNRVDVAIVER
jgi:outer membrane protein OmpA-like peptidoglycan-associated protein